jgi:acyl dehydratase
VSAGASIELPQELAPVEGPLLASLCEGAVRGLGECGAPMRDLLDAGLAPPDVLTGMTLHLLANQPRRPRTGREPRGAIEGGVWVREQVTYHAPVRVGSAIRVTGSSARRFARRGRRYGVTLSETRSEAGELLVSSCTTGLLSYRRDPELVDEAQGVAESELPIASPDYGAARANPCLEALRGLRAGDEICMSATPVTLEMMRLRDAGRDDNPIHTDPEVARREGLAAPIAGGGHVLAFLQAALIEAWGSECLLHGAHFDVRWVGQTRAETRIRARAMVVSVTPSLGVCALEIHGEDRPVLQGTLSLLLGVARE